MRGKNVKEKISEFFGIVQVCSNTNNPGEDLPNRILQKSSGELLLASTQHDGDAYFEAEKVIAWGENVCVKSKYEEENS